LKIFCGINGKRWGSKTRRSAHSCGSLRRRCARCSCTRFVHIRKSGGNHH
jgi:hypothetical protein